MSNKSVALLTIHGMGDTPKNYHTLFLESIKKQMGENWKRVAFGSLYYQDILQINQNEIYRKMKRYVDWKEVRKFILYGFSDAANLDYRSDQPNSLYKQTQQRLADYFTNLYQKQGNIPIVIVAYSLGCHVLSNYIWDANKEKNVSAGIWKYNDWALKITDPIEKDFLKLRTLHHLITIGCNIPVFVSGYQHINPFNKPNKKFKWINMYDKDDVLGWPLEPLSKSYRSLVEDVAINAKENIKDLLLKSWNPLSHESYFGDKQVIKTVANALNEFI
jgi:hypothetical protein